MAKPEGCACLLWPVAAIWHLTRSCLGVIVRFGFILAGFLLMVAGVLVSLTLVGVILGIPMMLLGLLLMIKGIF